jgi:hypothetical protein
MVLRLRLVAGSAAHGFLRRSRRRVRTEAEACRGGDTEVHRQTVRRAAGSPPGCSTQTCCYSRAHWHAADLHTAVLSRLQSEVIRAGVSAGRQITQLGQWP